MPTSTYRSEGLDDNGWRYVCYKAHRAGLVFSYTAAVRVSPCRLVVLARERNEAFPGMFVLPREVPFTDHNMKLLWSSE